MRKFMWSKYQKMLQPFRRGGKEIHHTSKKIFIGCFLVLTTFLFIELLYVLTPSPLDFLLNELPLLLFTFALVVIIFFVVVPFFQVYNSYHEIGPNHLISVKGLLFGLKREENLVPYDLILGCEVRQTIFGRIFDFGDLLIGTRMTGKVEFVLEDINNPHGARREIENKMG